MQRDFWKDRWDRGEIAFHRDEIHPTLLANVNWWLDRPCRVLVPLCGKTLDVVWLAKRGHSVVGVEFVRDAVEKLFEENRMDADVERVEGFEVFRSGRIEVWCGDWFKADPRVMGTFERVWDRAAMVAVDPATREDYVFKLRSLLSDDAIVLLDVVSERPDPTGPPWAVTEEDVRRLYVRAQVQKLEERDDARPGFKNAVYAIRQAAM